METMCITENVLEVKTNEVNSIIFNTDNYVVVFIIWRLKPYAIGLYYNFY